jgi:hypothetical protein
MYKQGSWQEWEQNSRDNYEQWQQDQLKRQREQEWEAEKVKRAREESKIQTQIQDTGCGLYLVPWTPA